MTATKPTTVPTDNQAGGDGRTARDGRVFYGWWIVAALAVTQTVGYGVLYYAFAVLLVPMATALHTSTTAVTGAYTASVLAGAVLAVAVGRWLDRHGGRGLMTCGSIAGTLLIVAWANVHTVAQLYAVQIGIGLASALALYEPAFAVIVHWFDPARRPTALLALTVVAGFASSIFLPLTGQLVDHYGWRHALVLLAVGHGALAIPLHALVLRRPPVSPSPHRRDLGSAGEGRRRVMPTVPRNRRFWLLTAGFTVHAAAISTFTVHLVAALTAWGHATAFAATIAGLLGVLSVTGRLVTTSLQRYHSTATVVAAVFAVQAIAAATLPLIGHNTPGVVITVIGFGIGFGVATIARPALLAQQYGTTGFATISGVVAVPVTIAKAFAPMAAAALHQSTATYGPVFVAIAVACAAAAIALPIAAKPDQSPAHWSRR